MLVGIWQKRARLTETVTALSYEQHGFYEQALQSYQQVMIRLKYLFETVYRASFQMFLLLHIPCFS